MAKLTVIPALQYRDARAAIAFLTRAFGFAEKAVYDGPDGAVAHAELMLGNGMVMLGSVKETDYSKLLVRPEAAGGVTMSVYCVVTDADAHFARADGRGRHDRARAGDAGLRRARLHREGPRGERVDLRDV